MDIIFKYFPELTETQRKQFEQLMPLYEEWNAKINVVSRKDIEYLPERHILHSLGLSKVIQFKEGTTILDIGTGGGFPGIPLAIMFPKVNFHLVDSIGKKILVVQSISEALGLNNVKAEKARAENLADKYDFVMSRGVTNLEELKAWSKHKFNKHYNNSIKNGLLVLKGGDLTEEKTSLRQKGVRVWEMNDFFEEEFFETKKIIYIPMI